jgi:hypothetical protein
LLFQTVVFLSWHLGIFLSKFGVKHLAPTF